MQTTEQKPVDPSRKMPIWYLAGPFFQYEEDVKALARRAGARIIDATVTADRSNALPEDQTPTVTIKAQYKPISDDERLLQQAVLAQFRELSPEQQANAVAAAKAAASLSPEAQAAIEQANKAAAGAAKPGK